MVKLSARAQQYIMNVEFEEDEDYDYICEGCGRHLPCRHCEE